MTDPEYSKCLLPFKLAYFGSGQVLLKDLKPEEQNIGFCVTFEDSFQMMEVVDQILNPTFTTHKSASTKELSYPWESTKAIESTLSTTSPNSPPYCAAQPIDNISIGDSSLDADLEKGNSSFSDWSANEERE